MSKNVLGISLIAAVLYTAGHYLSHWFAKLMSMSADQAVLFVSAVVFVVTFLGTWFVLRLK